jgi:D-xylose reductase
MAGTAEGQSCVLSNGSKMPLFGLGTWKIAKSVCLSLTSLLLSHPIKVVADVVYDSIVAGVRHLDCACDYGNEVEVGNGIKRAIDAGIVKRQDLWVDRTLTLLLL